MDSYSNKSVVYSIIYLVLDFMITQQITTTVTLAMTAAPAADPPAITANGRLALVFPITPAACTAVY